MRPRRCPVILLLALIRALAADRARLATENLLLRQQVLVLKRSVKRVRLDDGDRAFWVAARRLLRDWREHLVIVKPGTVVRWHREAFRRFWRARSRPGAGRPPIGADVIALIRRMSAENPLWGAPRIASELALLGHVVADSTVAKYVVPSDKGPSSQTWRTFLKNHLGVSAPCDLFTVPTLTFKVLYAFVVLSHDRRRILHVNVTRHPTAAWVAQQLTEAFPGDAFVPRYLHRDRDTVYGEEVRRRIAAIGMEDRGADEFSGLTTGRATLCSRARPFVHLPPRVSSSAAARFPTGRDPLRHSPYR